MDSNAVFAVLLLIIGLAILLAEVFIPSGGLLGVITFFALVLSVMFAYQAWGTSHPNIFYVFLIMLVLLVPSVVVFGFYMLPRTSFGKRVLLEAPDSKDLKPYAREMSHLSKLVGHYGTTLTMLNPGGLVNLDGERLHALSEGLSIEPGEWVEIVNIRGSSVIVRAGTPPETATHEQSSNSSEMPMPMDFEFPAES